MPTPLVTAEQMREMDRVTIEEIGIPGPVLMEVAGRAAADAASRMLSEIGRGPVAVLCGAGNNGGDGYVIARHLRARGTRADVLLFAPRARLQGDALLNYEVLEKLGVPIEDWANLDGPDRLLARLADQALVVDALLGTGLSSAVRGPIAHAIAAVNGAGVPVLAVDIPSGLSADSGQPLGDAVRADLTVTFGYAKIGQATWPGAELVGELEVVDIGLAPGLPERLGVDTHLIDPSDVVGLLPPRSMADHKGTYGHLLVVAGSHGKTGAAILAARAAGRSGAGLVTIATPADIQPAMEAQLLEAMSANYAPSMDGIDPTEAVRAIAELARGKKALAIGPGIPVTAEMGKVLAGVLAEVELPLVLDADGLNLVASQPKLLADARAPLALTPHPGEMARLLGRPNAEVQADRIGAARALAAQTGAVVALKGARTVIADPHGQIAINPTGNPGLASGGTGAVLTGLVGGFLAQGLSAWDALRLGVYVHGLAGDLAATCLGEPSLLAGDLLAEIPAILRDW